MRSTGHAVLRFLPLTFVLASGCVHRYTEPALTEPHATLKLRTVFHERTGPQLDLTVRIMPGQDEYGIDMPSDEDALRVLRVRLLPTRYRIQASFFHTIMQMQTVYETEQYACGTQTYGTSTQTRYCSRQVPRQRMVSTRVRDGDCEADAFQSMPIERGIYLVQFDYAGNAACSMSCMRQLDTGGGTFRFVPCGSAEPPGDVTSGSEQSVAVINAVPPAPPAYTAPPPSTPVITPSGMPY